MRVILMTSEPYRAANVSVQAFLGNTLLKKYGIEVVGIVSTSMWNRGPSWLAEFIKHSGLRFALRTIVTNVWHTATLFLAKRFMPDKHRLFFDTKELAQKLNIPHHQTRDINSEKTYTWIKKQKPDMLVSSLLIQIVKKKLLDLPSGGSINFHPALVQDHRGTFASFWALLQGKNHSGATVHYMTEEVDEGEIVLQRRFFITPSDTIHCVNLKSAQLGGNLLVKALVKIKKQKTKTPWIPGLGNILGLPSRKETKAFEAKGRKHIRWQDFFRI